MRLRELNMSREKEASDGEGGGYGPVRWASYINGCL